jgi:hypothetical protein
MSGFQFNSYEVLKVDIDTNQLTTHRQPDGIVLYLNSKLHPLMPEKLQLGDVDLTYTTLTGFFRLQVGNNSYFLTHLPSTQVNFFISHKHQACGPRHHQIRIPLSYCAIEQIERERTGDYLDFRLHLELGLIVFGPPHGSVKLPEDAPHRIRETDTLKYECHLPVKTADWINQVLPSTEKGIIYIAEFPIGNLEQTTVYQQSVNALKQAEKYFRNGDYDDAVGKCRVALEQVLILVDTEDGRRRNLDPKWAKTLQGCTFEWLEKVLKKCVWDYSHDPHHKDVSHFSRHEAQLIISLTITCLSYLGNEQE